MAVNERTGIESAIDLADYEIEQVEDVREALQRARSEATRIVIAEGGEPVGAVIPMDDLFLLLRLEDEEFDRIDAEEIAKRRADPAEEPISWEEARDRLGL